MFGETISLGWDQEDSTHKSHGSEDGWVMAIAAGLEGRKQTFSCMKWGRSKKDLIEGSLWGKAINKMNGKAGPWAWTELEVATAAVGSTDIRQ